ncbi:MAG: VOC family protein [Bdellovibrionota bacterium]
MTKPIPDGYHSVTPSLTFKDSRRALEFYSKALGAKVLNVFDAPHGKGVMHAVMQIGNSMIMMGDEPPEQSCKSAETLGATPITLCIYVEDADSLFNQAIEAGAKVMMPMGDMFWGDRAGSLVDPFGYTWMVSTHQKDLSKDEMKKGAEEFFAQMKKNH